MKANIKNKKTKFTTNTYMKEAIEYKTLVVKGEENYFITIKKYEKVESNFKMKSSTIPHIENGSFMVEFTPLDDYFNIRFYVTKDYKLLDFYIDISLENGVKNKIPYYVDLYLDIVHSLKDDSVYFIDEDELLEAYKNKFISKRDYDFAYMVGRRLLKEIRENKNKFLNMDIVKILKANGF